MSDTPQTAASAYKIIDHDYDVVVVGAGYELKTNRFWSVMVLVGAVALTAITWTWIIMRLPI